MMFKNGLKVSLSFLDVVKTFFTWFLNKLASSIVVIITLIMIASLVMNYIYYKKGVLITYDNRTFISTTTFQGQSQSTNIYGKEIYMGKNRWTKIVVKEEDMLGLLHTLTVYQTDKLIQRNIKDNMIEVYVPVVEMKQTSKVEQIEE